MIGWIADIADIAPALLSSGASLLAAASTGAAADTSASGGAASLSLPLRITVDFGMVSLVLGIVLCLYRVLRGPHIADRVLAADALSMQVVGLVILLTLRLGTTAFFDVALVVAIIGFATTLAFAQYIGAHAQAKQRQDDI